MSATVTIEEAQASLKELVHRLSPGEEVVITENEQPVARLVSALPKPSGKQRPSTSHSMTAFVMGPYRENDL